MKVLITGASGFVGSHVLEALCSERLQILALTRDAGMSCPPQSNLTWLVADLSQVESYQAAVREFNPETVIHLSWGKIPDYSAAVCIDNAFDSVRFFDFIVNQTKCKRIIGAGSCMEYSVRYGVCAESTAVCPYDHFSWSKTFVQEYLRILSLKTRIEFVWFRIFYVFGSGQRHEALIPTIIQAAATRKEIPVRSPDSEHDFVYVKDVANAFRLAVIKESIISGVYNVGSGYPESVRNICRLIYDEYGRSHDVESLTPYAGSGNDTKISFWADTKKLKLELGWQRDWTLKRAITDLLG